MKAKQLTSIDYLGNHTIKYYCPNCDSELKKDFKSCKNCNHDKSHRLEPKL